MKLSNLIFAFLICVSCNSESEYNQIQQLVKENKEDIFKLIDNAAPEVKKTMTEYLNSCIKNTEKEFLSSTGKGKRHLKEFGKTIRFFVSKIEDARKFQPNQNQNDLYNELKAYLEENQNYIVKYIKDNKFDSNTTDRQRRRTFDLILKNDIHEFQKHLVITEEEFNENIKFLVVNWEDILYEIQLYYGLKDLDNKINNK